MQHSRRSSARSMRFLLMLLLGLTVLPILLIRTGMYFRLVQAQYRAELQSNLEIARAAAIAFETYLDDVAQQEAAISSAIVSLAPFTQEQATRFLVRSASGYPSVRGFH